MSIQTEFADLRRALANGDGHAAIRIAETLGDAATHTPGASDPPTWLSVCTMAREALPPDAPNSPLKRALDILWDRAYYAVMVTMADYL